MFHPVFHDNLRIATERDLFNKTITHTSPTKKRPYKPTKSVLSESMMHSLMQSPDVIAFLHSTKPITTREASLSTKLVDSLKPKECQIPESFQTLSESHSEQTLSGDCELDDMDDVKSESKNRIRSDSHTINIMMNETQEEEEEDQASNIFYDASLVKVEYEKDNSVEDVLDKINQRQDDGDAYFTLLLEDTSDSIHEQPEKDDDPEEMVCQSHFCKIEKNKMVVDILKETNVTMNNQEINNAKKKGWIQSTIDMTTLPLRIVMPITSSLLKKSCRVAKPVFERVNEKIGPKMSQLILGMALVCVWPVSVSGAVAFKLQTNQRKEQVKAYFEDIWEGKDELVI